MKQSREERMKMRTKSSTLLFGTEEGWSWNIRVGVYENGTFSTTGASFHLQNQKSRHKRDLVKERIRAMDRTWVYRNIPSSIHWHTQIHHDWANNGTMYLLAKGEHILRHRREKE